MDLIEEHPIRRFKGNTPSAIVDKVITEARIELEINEGKYRIALLALPQYLEELAVGFLLGEGALRRREDLTEVKVLPESTKVEIRGDFDLDALEAMMHRWTWGSGCGGGGTGRDLDSPPYAPVGPGPCISPERLHELARIFASKGEFWRQTGGVHLCALADNDGIIFFAEDVGRHNAFDKVVGKGFLEGIDISEKLLLTTGRLSGEIVSKAVASQVPMLVSRSAVTNLGVKLARRFGITLVGFLRSGRMNVYTGFQRIVAGENRKK